MVVETVDEDIPIYFLKYSESSSTIIYSFASFLFTGGDITSLYERLTSIFNNESLNKIIFTEEVLDCHTQKEQI